MIQSLTLAATSRMLKVAVCLLASTAQAASVEESIVAIMRLSEQPSYAWTATITDDARTYDIIGKTVRGGFTHVKMPVINSVRRQLGRGVTDTQIDLIYRGNTDCVIETDEGWKRLEELPLIPAANAPSARSTSTITLPGASGAGAAITLGGAGAGATGAGASPLAYSNLQLGISHPHEELGVIVSSHVDFKVEGNVITGTLSDRGAQLLLVRDGQDSITPLRAGGSFKIWLRAGVVAKYQVTVEGTLEVRHASGRKEVTVRQTTDTVLRDVGKTTVEVPDEARVKLGA